MGCIQLIYQWLRNRHHHFHAQPRVGATAPPPIHTAPPPVRVTRVTSFGTATGTISVELWLPPLWTGWPLACLGPQYFAFGIAMRSFTTERDDGGGGVGGWRWLGSGGVLGCLCPTRLYACGGVFGCFGPALAFNDDGFTT